MELEPKCKEEIELFTLRAWASEFATLAPIELEPRSKEEREVFTQRTWESEFAPSSPMELEPKFKEEREGLPWGPEQVHLLRNH